MNTHPLIAVAVLAASSLAHAQPITDSFNYQGTLEDSGAPANGLYDVTFLIYDAEVGGFPIASGTVSVLGIEVVDGLFETNIDFGTTGVIFDTDSTRWLELQVSEAGQPGFTTLAPRQRIDPAPYANYAQRAGHANTSGTTLQQAFENGNSIFVSPEIGGVLEMYSHASRDAAIRISNENEDDRVAIFENGFGTGDVAIYGNDTNIIARMYTDTSAGGGGYHTIARNDAGDVGIVLEGNHFGTESARLFMTGNSTFTFNASETGNSSAVLPVGAIDSIEIHNEVGVAEVANSALITLMQDLAAIEIIDSVTLNAPASGYALVLATAEVSVSHATLSTSTVNIGVSNNAFVMPTNGDIEIRIPTSASSGLYDYPVTVHSILPVSEGVNTFYLLGDQNYIGGSVSILDRQLSAIYIPTAYGSAGLQSGAAFDDQHTQITAPMSELDILREQNASMQANMERQQRELEAMEAKVQTILSTLDQDAPDQHKAP